MKIKNMPVKVLSLSIAFSLSALYAYALHAEPVSLLDYEEVSSSYQQAYVDGYFEGQGGNQEQSSYKLDVDAKYEGVMNTPDRKIEANLRGYGKNSRGPSQGDKSTSDYFGSATLEMDNYFQPDSRGAFWYGQGGVQVQKGMENPQSEIEVGLGYGRVINVTSMAKAIRIVEELREKKILSRFPDKEAYQRVAGIIDKEKEYRAKYGVADYAQYWLLDIEKALKESGAMKSSGSFGADSILKMHDILINEKISPRKHGWSVRGGVGYQISNFNGGSGNPTLGTGAEYHYPLSNQTQFSNEFSLSKRLNDQDTFDLSNEMSLTHEISDKIDWINTWTVAYNKYDSSKEISRHDLSSKFSYDLTNKLEYFVEAKLTDIEDDEVNGNEDIDKSLRMGISYRLK